MGSSPLWWEVTCCSGDPYCVREDPGPDRRLVGRVTSLDLNPKQPVALFGGDQAIPEPKDSDERSPSRDGRQEPLLYQGSPVKGGHQAQRCEMFYLAEDLRHLSVGWHWVRVEHELQQIEKRGKRREGRMWRLGGGNSTCSCRVRETMEHSEK